MISFAIAKTVFSGKLGYLLIWSFPVVAVFAVTEAFLGNLIIAIVASVIGASPATIAIIMLSRKQSTERRIAQEVLLQNQKKMAEDLDGKLDSLRKAEQGQAKAEGIIEGGDKEQARVAAVSVELAIPPAIPKVEIVQPPDKPVPVKTDKQS